jgi:hypothetical protein
MILVKIIILLKPRPNILSEQICLGDIDFPVVHLILALDLLVQFFQLENIDPIGVDTTLCQFQCEYFNQHRFAYPLGPVNVLEILAAFGKLMDYMQYTVIPAHLH